MAKASIASETCRCQPCQDRVSLWSSPSSVFAVSNASSIAQRCPSTVTRLSIPVPAGHQVEKNASWPSAMLRRIRSPRVHRPVSPSASSPASRSASSPYAQSSSRSPFVPRGEALPGALLEPCGDRLGGAGHGRLVAPGGEPIRGIRAPHIALASPSQPDLDLATPLHGVRGYPTERDAGRKRPLDHRQRKPRLGGEGGSGRDMSARHAGRVAGPGLW